MNMTMNLSVVVLCVLFYHLTYVSGTCYSCTYKTSKANCLDTYVPPGHEESACDEIDDELCQKYDTAYSVYCDIGALSYKCHWKATRCSNKGGHSHPLFSFITLMSFLVVIVTP